MHAQTPMKGMFCHHLFVSQLTESRVKRFFCAHLLGLNIQASVYTSILVVVMGHPPPQRAKLAI